MFFFFNDTATTEIYTLSLHDALPICGVYFLDVRPSQQQAAATATPSPRDVFTLTGQEFDRLALTGRGQRFVAEKEGAEDRKSTRLKSSHANISYAVFCLKKKNKRRSR